MSEETPDVALPFSDVWRQMEFEIERLRAENEQLKNMINLYDEMVAVLLPSWEVGSDDDEKAEYMITYTNIKKALG